LHEAPLPAIIHWKGYHWVVLYGRRGRKYVVADPAVGIRYIPKKELIEGWPNGVMLCPYHRLISNLNFLTEEGLTIVKKCWFPEASLVPSPPSHLCSVNRTIKLQFVLSV
jgi:hypothetical protein